MSKTERGGMIACYMDNSKDVTTFIEHSHQIVIDVLAPNPPLLVQE